ncbi:MAG: Threonylcarbamoyl-AMP synthase [Candidatus Celerinatantimonas neptuna]|nr:MAG: Threonylcarbamoyl-AMP synthase [Candidatus Celerinatantimonas neptuna]
MSTLVQTVDALHGGKVVAYPTEGLFGLGCDPDKPAAIEQLLTIKQRSREKGLILIAASFEQLAPYVDLSTIEGERQEQIFASWPGPVTWVLPASEYTSQWVTGKFDTVAVRVSDHPQVVELCLAFGKPLISTSANLSGHPAAVDVDQVESQMGTYLAAILSGETGGRNKPSMIIDGRSGNILREG